MSGWQKQVSFLALCKHYILFLLIPFDGSFTWPWVAFSIYMCQILYWMLEEDSLKISKVLFLCILLLFGSLFYEFSLPWSSLYSYLFFQCHEPYGFCLISLILCHGLITLKMINWAVIGFISLFFCLLGIFVLLCLMSNDLKIIV